MAETSPRRDRRKPDLAQRIAGLEQEFKANPDKSVNKLAEAYLAGGRPKDAIRVLEKHQNGKDTERGLLLAQAWFDLFENRKSASILKNVVSVANVDNNVRAQMLLGELAFEEGRQGDARKHLNRVRSLDPTLRRAAELLKNMGEAIDVPQETDDEAALGFRTEVEGRESFGKAFLQVGLGLLVGVGLLAGYYVWSQNNFKAKKLAVEGAELTESADTNTLRLAEAKYLEALEYQSSNEYAISGLAEIYALLWVDLGFEDMKAKAIQFTERAKDAKIEKAERFGAELLVLYGEGRYDEAEQLAASVVERGAKSEKVYYGLGLTQRATGKLKLGRDNLRRAHDLRGNAPHYETALGDAYDEDNDNRNAVFFWNRAKDHNSSYVRGVARSIMGRAGKGHQPKHLFEELDSLDALDPSAVGTKDKAAVEVARATVLARVGKNKEALAAVNRAIELDGETPRRLVTRGQILLSTGKPGKGFADIEAARTRAKGAARYLYDLVNAYLDYGKPGEAVKALKLEAGLQSQLPAYHATLGDALRLAGKPDEAIAAYDKALKLYEDYPDARLGRGYVFYGQKKYEEATAEFEKAVEVASKEPRIYVAVGTMWVDQGYGDQGVTQLAHAEKLYLGQGASQKVMTEFYAGVIKALTRNRGNASKVKAWVAKEKTYRDALGE